MLTLDITSPVSFEPRLPGALYVPQGRDFDVTDFLRAATARLTGQSAPELGVQTDVHGVATGGMNQFGLSPVTDLPLQSAPFNNCLCIAAVGQSTSPEHRSAQLGVLGHFTPGPGVTPGITRDIESLVLERMRQLRTATQDDTRALIIAGGGLDTTHPDTLADSLEVYFSTLDLLERAAETLGVMPQVLQPVLGSHHRYITLQTQERRLVVSPLLHPLRILPPHILPLLGQAAEVRQRLLALLQPYSASETPAS